MRYASEPPETADLVVVGGGIVGAATAFHASRAGLSTVLVEARPALCTLTTPVSAGAFRLQFDNEEELSVVRESVDLFLDFEARTGQRVYRPAVRQQGYLWLATTEDMAVRQRELVARMASWGLTDVEVLDGDETRTRFPFVGSNVIQSRFRAGDGFVDTKQLTFGLAEGSGATVVTDCRATGFVVSADRVTGVRTTRGDVSANAVVVAGGPLTPSLVATVGVELSVQAVRRHKLWMPGLDVVPTDAPMTIDEETAAHWRPAFRGAWVLFTDPSTPPSDPQEAVPPDPGFAFEVLDPRSPASVARVVPFWGDVWEHGAHHWVVQAGQYTVTPDHRPLIGPAGTDGLFVNTGYSGHGIMLSPAASRIVVEAITGTLDAGAHAFAADRTFVPGQAPTL